jgi:hypothetical protein
MIERMKYPDSKNAKSIFEASIKQMNYTLTLKSNDESAFNIIRNIYECFRMLGDALLVKRGQISEDHVEQIKALQSLNVGLERPIQIVDNLRRMRHNINYYGFNPKKFDSDDALSFANSCFFKLAEAVSREIDKN